jgi:hypothetical protein
VNRTQVAKPKTRRERSWRELLPPDPYDPDVVRVKALARVAGPSWLHGIVISRNQTMAISAPKSGDAFPPELLRLLGTAQQMIDEHVNREGRCAQCASPWPCRQAALAEFTLGSL